MSLSERKVAVVGLGASGVAAARLCLAQGAAVIVFDEAAASALSDDAKALQPLGASFEHGPLAPDCLLDFELVVVSPGMPPRAALDAAEKAGCEVIGELELASRFLSVPIVLIGGTNGKSTVTALVGEMLTRAGLRTFVGGNFGPPLSDAVGGDHEMLVVELSSFQAERMPTLHPRVHALLNITEDHLDRYPSFAAYASAKGNAFATMTADDVAIIPSGDEACLAQAQRGPSQVVRFGAPDGQVSVVDGDIVDSAYGERFPVSWLKLRGAHNVANACAAVAIAGALKIDPEAVGATLKTFAGLPHRNELVAELSGVRFYNDSKATNVGAAVAALAGMAEARAVLIAGGRDKEGAYEPLVRVLHSRGRALVVIGEAAERIAAAVGEGMPIVRAKSMDDAVRQAAALAEAGDAVLLSPACSSYDMFASYRARGDAFAAAVKLLQESRS